MIKKSILSLSAALILQSSTALASDVQKVYATVNGKTITGADISLVLKNPQLKFETLPADTQKNVLKGLVDKKLLGSIALNSDVTNEEIYKTTLKSTIENIKEELALQLWMQKESKNIIIKDKELKDYFKNNSEKFVKPIQLKASHILVKTKDEANTIIASLKKSKNLKADFTKLAKEKSTGPSGSKGGELGWFTMDKMVPEFSDATSKLSINSITKTPVKTQFGFHIIYLDDKKEKSTVSFAEIKENIRAFLAQEKFKKHVDSLIKKESKTAKIIYK